MMSNIVEDIQPFLGRMLIEIVRESAEDHLKKQMESTGVSKEFLDRFEIAGVKSKKTPISKGRVVKVAPDAFGEAFKGKYGEDYVTPKVGDIVFFIPNESYRLDSTDTYHLIADCDVVAYTKGE